MDDASESNRTRRGSLVWPILLIGAGVIFLLINLGLLPANAWVLILRLWPLALILLGLDLLVGRRSTAGMLISGLIALVFIAGLIGLLLVAPSIPALSQLGSPGELKTQTLQVPLENFQSARVTIDWSSAENRLSGSQASSANLLEGQVQYYGDLIFDARNQGQHVEIQLDSRFVSTGLVFPSLENTTWSVALHPRVMYDLIMNSGSGRNDFDISGLQLREFSLDAGSGAVNLSLPPGSYSATLDGGSGAIRIRLPAEAAARIELESGSGSFNPSPSLSLVSGEANDDGTWETANFAQATERFTLNIDQGSGAITLEQ